MLSQIPIQLEKISPENLDKELLRVGIIAEEELQKGTGKVEGLMK